MNFKQVRRELLRRSVRIIHIKNNIVRDGNYHIQEIENHKRNYYPFDIFFGSYIKEKKYYIRADSLKNVTMDDILQLYYDGFLVKYIEHIGLRTEVFIIQLKEGRL